MLSPLANIAQVILIKIMSKKAAIEAHARTNTVADHHKTPRGFKSVWVSTEPAVDKLLATTSWAFSFVQLL
jgi:hypothetical protein